jgi:mono/diheme cytochrome c family protein
LLLLPLVVALAGCGSDVYSESMVYPVRSDPVIIATRGDEVGEPDQPGQLPLYSIKDATDPRNPFYLDLKNKNDKFKYADPLVFTKDQRDELQEALESAFGTPANPKVELITEETRKLLRLDRETLAEGSRLYRLYCLQCHGLTGDGRGPTAKWVNPHPRDYRPGLFKFQSVDQATDGATRPPRRDDLYRTIYEGVEGTAMQSYNMLKDGEIQPIISYVIHLSIRGEVEQQVFKNTPVDEDKTENEPRPRLVARTNKLKGGSIITYIRGKRDSGGMVRDVAEKWREAQEDDKKIVPGPYRIDDHDINALRQSIQNGYEIFMSRGPVSGACTQCHYDFGRKSLFKFDEWGTMVRPRDLTKNAYRGGRRPVDLYYRIHSGINGSGMLKQGKSLSPEQIWDVVNFVRALPYPEMRGHVMPKID